MYVMGLIDMPNVEVQRQLFCLLFGRPLLLRHIKAFSLR